VARSRRSLAASFGSGSGEASSVQGECTAAAGIEAIPVVAQQPGREPKAWSPEPLFHLLTDD
jgi:hypothetical protein